MQLDNFYTPTYLAEKLINLVKVKNPKIIADFCAGDGELIRAAEAKWGKAKFIVNDISKLAINKIKKKHKQWLTETYDFSCNKLIEESSLLCSIKSKCDLILLNPPFSCCGSAKYSITLDGKTYSASKALVFVVNALQFLADGAKLYAILPAGVAYSERDESLWSDLEEYCNLKILYSANRSLFNNCSPNIIIVELERKHIPNMPTSKIMLQEQNTFSFIRGGYSVTKKSKNLTGKYKIIHSTNLRNNKICGTFSHSDIEGERFKTKVLLVQRVGVPKKDKIIIAKLNNCILSDCVIAIIAQESDLSELKKTILDNWDSFLFLYQGTCAKFVTLKRLNSFIINHYKLL